MIYQAVTLPLIDKKQPTIRALKSLGIEMRCHRIRLGLKQTEMVDHLASLGVMTCQSIVTRMERGCPRVKPQTRTAITSALGLVSP